MSRMARKSKRMFSGLIGATVLLVWMTSLFGCPEQQDPLDASLATIISRHDLRPVQKPRVQNQARVTLGQALFFDKILGGNQDVACATCHHPSLATGDDREISIGVGGEGLGKDRVLAAERETAPRNASALFDLGDPAWRVQFWDGRVERYDSGTFRSPAAGYLPDGLDGLAAAQAMFPVTSREEMRGERGDVRLDGEPNELGALFDSELTKIWGRLMNRLVAIPEYRDLFMAAYPGIEPENMGFEYAANAIAAFEIEAFSLTDSPWDRYLAGDKDAMTEAQKQGALLFFGEAGCGSCHTGPLLTDQKYYNLGVPQLGPGKAPEEPLDNGRARVTMNPQDNHKFRTPSLRQVTATPPYMHSGAYHKLEDVILHHMQPKDSYIAYDASHLPKELQSTVLSDAQYRDVILATIAPELSQIPDLSEAQIDSLVVFLGALESPQVEKLERWVPESVPSGLPVD